MWPVCGADEAHTNVPPGRLDRHHVLGEIGPVEMKKVLAMRFGSLQHQSIQDSGG
jgi:hypothetical protein